MNVLIASPASRKSNRGNAITAGRWQTILKELGHHVVIESDTLEDFDCLIAIHAVHSHKIVCEFRQRYPEKLVLVCLSGTDLYAAFGTDNIATDSRESEPGNETVRIVRHSLDLADAIILLEPEGGKRLPAEYHRKCHVIFQSAEQVNPSSRKQAPHDKEFRVCVLGHLRDVKDPLRAAMAARQLPANSRIQILQAGDVLEEKYFELIKQEMASNPRYRWLGKLNHDDCMDLLVQSQLMVLSSIHEGAPAVISESVVNGIPILCSKIDATVGLLGADYAGFFPVRHTAKLKELMMRAESDPEYLNRLKQQIRKRAPLFSLAAEKQAWAELLPDLRRNNQMA